METCISSHNFTIIESKDCYGINFKKDKCIPIHLYTFIFKCGRIGGMQLKLLMAIAYLMSPQLIACAILWLRLASKWVGGRIVGQCVYKS